MSNPFDSNSEIATQVTTGPSFSFFDSIEASFRRGQQIDSTLSIEAEVQSRWENSVRKYEEVTGQKTGADFSMTTVHQLIAPKLNQNADRVLADAWFTGSKPDDDSGWADPMNPNAPVINPARQRLEKSQQVAEQIKALKRADIPDLDAILEQVRTGPCHRARCKPSWFLGRAYRVHCLSLHHS